MTRELLQQALDALTYQGTMGPTRRQRRHAAIEAIRAHLAQPQEHSGVPGIYGSGPLAKACGIHVQPQGEPVDCFQDWWNQVADDYEVTDFKKMRRSWHAAEASMTPYLHPAHTEAEVQAIINCDGDLEGVVRHFLRVPAP